MKTFLNCLFLIACITANANETNTLDVAKNDRSYWPTKADGAIWPEKLVAGKIPRECLPAKDFSEGNWGQVTNGCQVSLRFSKQAFTNGEPIEGIILMRNVTNQPIPVLVHPSGRWDDLVGYVVSNRLGKLYINQNCLPGFNMTEVIR